MEITDETLGVMLDIIESGKELPKDEFGRFDFAQELNNEYRKVGLDYPDLVIQNAVTLLADDYFTHRPHKDWAAKLYVRRKKIGRIAGAVLGLSILIGTGVSAIQGTIQRHRAAEREAVVLLEQRDEGLLAKIAAMPPQGEAAQEEYFRLKRQYASAADRNDTGELRRLQEELTTLNDRLSLEYRLEVDCEGQTGFTLDEARRFLVVNPIAGNTRIAVPVIDKHTKQTTRVDRFALGVDAPTYQSFIAYQDAHTCELHSTIGNKQRGFLNPAYSVGVRADDMLSRWE